MPYLPLPLGYPGMWCQEKDSRNLSLVGLDTLSLRLSLTVCCIPRRTGDLLPLEDIVEQGLTDFLVGDGDPVGFLSGELDGTLDPWQCRSRNASDFLRWQGAREVRRCPRT